MYRKILAAINEHLNSEISARYALHLARACGARCYLCFVAGKGMNPAVFNRAEESLKRLFRDAQAMGVEIEAITRCGDPVETLRDVVKQGGVDLIFAATFGQETARHGSLSAVAKHLLTAIPCSVALVRAAHIGRSYPREILVPLKTRINHIPERVYFTAMVAQAFGAEIFLFHAPKPITRFFHGEVHLTPHQWDEKVPKEITLFMEHLQQFSVSPVRKMVPGRSGSTITREAFLKRHDLIIMGASERGCLSALFYGNPVDEVLRHTPCDIIIFRPRHEDT